MTSSRPAFQEVAAQWDERYRDQDRVWRVEPNEILVDLLRDVTVGSAVDLGAGEGRNALWLAQQHWHVTAVDASTVGLAKVARYAEEAGLSIETIVEDIWAFTARSQASKTSFDLVVLAYLQVSKDERAELLEIAAGLVGPGGHLFVIAHHMDSLGISGPPDAERLFVEADLAAVPGLTQERLELWRGPSDQAVSGTDVFLWAARH